MIALLLGCAEPPAPEGLARRLVDVVSAPGATGEGFHDVTLAVNGVRGGGRWQGGLDVFSLGADELVLSVPEPVLDGDGPELAVFENPFDVPGGGRFMDPAVVEVSADCERFVAFPHAYLASDPTIYEDDPALWAGFAGVAPVELDVDRQPPLPPLDPVAGGDRFDLAELDGDGADEVLDQGVACVRVTSATTWADPATGLPYPAASVSDGADLDGVYVRGR